MAWAAGISPATIADTVDNHPPSVDESKRIHKDTSGRNGASAMNFDNTADESLVAYYENVRRQVDADIKSGGSYRFIGESVKQYADRLGEEMDRPRLRFTPIDWQR